MPELVQGSVRIYGLCEPGTTNVRYIGRTIHSLAKRLGQHISQAMRDRTPLQNKKVAWIKALRKRGQVPEVILLDIGDEDTWADLERFHIASHRSAGFALLNTTPGGEGHLRPVRKKGDTIRVKGYWDDDHLKARSRPLWRNPMVTPSRDPADVIARALRAVLISPNVTDSNLEQANLVDVGADIASALRKIAKSIDNLAEAVRGREQEETWDD